MTDKKTNNFSFKDSLKSMDTEETLDIYFYRPLGYAWARLFMKLGVTPNMVTIASIFIGITAGILFYYPDLKLNIIGMLLLVWANSYDSADGQLARMTNNKTRLGRILDGAAGNLWFITIYIALCLRLMNEGYGVWVWLLGAAAGAFHIQQASMSDYYRNVHLYFLKGKDGSEVENSENLVKVYEKMKESNPNFVKKFLYKNYVDYTKRQEMLSKNLQKFLGIVRSTFGHDIPKWLATEFRAMNKPLMKYTNILTFNTRAIALFVSLFIGKVWLYFVFELTILNIIFIYMILKQESISKYFYNKILSNEKID